MEFLVVFLGGSVFGAVCIGAFHFSTVRRLDAKHNKSASHAATVHREEIERKDVRIAFLEAEKANLKFELDRHTPVHDALGHFAPKNGVAEAAREAAKPDTGIAKGKGGKKNY